MATANKFVVIIQANQQDVGKAVHGLLYGQELHEEGYEVEILFDGAGTEWPNELSKADHPFNAVYKQAVKSGIVKGGCQACSNFHNVMEEMEGAGVPVIAGNDHNGGHISFAPYIKNGFLPIIL
jgi:hypothetical protein